MNIIYAVGTLKLDFSETPAIIKAQRLWSLFSTFDDAEQIVLTSDCDLFDCEYYNYAIIESIAISSIKDNVCTYSHAPKQTWFKAEFVDKFTVSKIDVPKEFLHIKYWFVG